MKIMMILDQIQAGFGGKENGDLKLGGKMLPIGSASMFDNYLKSVDGEIIATIYCGDDYYIANKEDVTRKIVSMTKKINPDVVICGPAFNYEKYGMLCAEVGCEIEEQIHIPVVAAMSEECSVAIKEFKDKLTIVKMPKKGGIGLTAALKNILTLAQLKSSQESIEIFVNEHCY